tara:strand:- start:1 stop:777 length:777 start_codon:yes stop_codon:yes gene_type:complete
MDNEANQPAADSGLLDSATVDDSNAAEQQNPENTSIDHLAPKEDDTPLDRPEWWPENFWKKDDSEPDLEGIAKSWMDLRKQISQGKHKAPVDGKYDTAAFGAIPDTDPVKGHVLSWAKEYGVSQAALDTLVGEVVKMGGDQVEQSQRTIEQERASLGPNADVMIKGMTDWARGLVNKGIWGKDDFEEFKYMGGTAKGLKALAKVREAYEGTRIPTQSMPVEGAPSKDELYQMVADPKYKSDPSYRAKVEKMFHATFGQ